MCINGHEIQPKDFSPRQIARFWASVDKTGSCWLWLGGKDPKGYGRIRIPGAAATGSPKWTGAHRFAYVLERGAFDFSLVLDHSCRVTACVNPAHLEPVTQAENLKRARERLNERK